MTHRLLDIALQVPGIDDPTGVIAVVGPTATGKSDLAVGLAEALDGEIVNADAMQLYRGMDIGTAKTPVAERRGIVHHQLDVLDVKQEASVAAYQRHARTDVGDILARGKRPIVVGGSGLYLRALLEEFAFPPTDPGVRARYEHRAETEGPGLLHDELARLDPDAAEKIDRANSRRIVRALEVIELTGKPFSASLPDPTYSLPTTQLGISIDPDTLGERIDARARRMFAGGLLDETDALLAAGLAEGVTASRATGYSQAISVLAGTLSISEATAQVGVATRQLARHQRTWFRRDDRIRWIEGGR